MKCGEMFAEKEGTRPTRGACWTTKIFNRKNSFGQLFSPDFGEHPLRLLHLQLGGTQLILRRVGLRKEFVSAYARECDDAENENPLEETERDEEERERAPDSENQNGERQQEFQ